MSIETMTKLATVTVGSGGSASIDFTNIPQTYTDLQIVLSGRYSTTTYPNAYISINGSTSSFTTLALYAEGASATSTTAVPRAASYNPGTNQTASTFGSTSIYIPNYTSSNYKSYSIDTVSENNGTTAYAGLFAGLWSNTSAITQVTLTPDTGNFVQHSTATLYGIKNMRKVAGNSLKATGGAISYDGTYVIHTFNSSDVFTPLQSLTNVDYLIVAGGGGGGASGAGAGGLRSTVTATGGGGSLESKISLDAGTPYAVTVGAGGAGSSDGQRYNGSNGGPSSFAGIVSFGGGGGINGFTPQFNNGINGGSGSGSYAGGDGAYTSQVAVGGLGTTGQGYAGGNAATKTVNTSSTGGGGGAGAVGSNAPSVDNAGAGGAGVTVNISGSAVSYAGGGGGGFYVNGSSPNGGLGGGGKGASANSAGSSGTPNTGGGAGGAYSETYKSAAYGGGSGVVIIRYKA